MPKNNQFSSQMKKNSVGIFESNKKMVFKFLLNFFVKKYKNSIKNRFQGRLKNMYFFLFNSKNNKIDDTGFHPLFKFLLDFSIRNKKKFDNDEKIPIFGPILKYIFFWINPKNSLYLSLIKKSMAPVFIQKIRA